MPDSLHKAADVRLEQTADGDPETRVVLSGDIDMATEPRLQRALQEISAGPARDLRADLSAVTFLGSHGLDFLVQLHLLATALERRFAVLNPRPAVRRAIQITGLDKILTVLEDDQI